MKNSPWLFALCLFASLAVLAQIGPDPATSPQGPNPKASVHTRQHTKLLAPHRPIPPRVPDAKRHPLPPAKAGSVIGGIWMTDANFKSSLYLRSVIATKAISVKPIIYLSNGTRLPLGDVKLDPDGVAVIDLSAELEKQGISGYATLAGYVEVQYNFPWNPICAMVRAFDPIHSLLFNYSLQPSLHVSRPKFKPGQSPVQPPLPTATAHTVEGLWWKQEANVTGFVGLANTTAQPLTATVSVSDQQATPIAQHTVTISPHGMKVVHLTELPSTVSNSGGITVSYTGLRDDLLVDGALQDPAVGYSAMLPFMFMGTELPDLPQTSLAELGLMVGAADPMMSFPAGTTFTPYSVLRNISDAPVTVEPTLWWMSSGSPQYADLPTITLGPHQSQLLDVTSVLASAGLASFTGSVNLVFDAQAKPGSLLVSAGSVDKSNTYVFAVYPRGIQESASKSLSYWSTANGDDTMVTLWNPADEAQNLIFRLNYSGGHYLLPIQLAPKATQAFNISDVIRNGTPDSEGNVIPPTAHEGSATLMGSQAKIQQILIAVDAATYNVKKATCGGICWSCDGWSASFVDLFNFGVGSNGAQRQESLLAWYDDTDYEGDLTYNAGWWSDNNGIMTVSTGMVTGQSPGTANISAFSPNDQIYNPNFCCQACTYCDSGVGGSTPGNVLQITNIDPDIAMIGSNSVQITIDGGGFGSSPVVNLPPGFTTSGQGSTGSRIVITVSIGFNATVGNNSISVTANGATSNLENFQVDGPYQMIVQNDVTGKCSGCNTTVARDVTYQIQNLGGTNAGATSICEVPTFSGWNCQQPEAHSYQKCSSPYTTFANGTFTDEWSMSSDSYTPSGCGFSINDYWEWAGHSPSPEELGNLSGYVHTDKVSINGIVSPAQMPRGTIIPF